MADITTTVTSDLVQDAITTESIVPTTWNNEIETTIASIPSLDQVSTTANVLNLTDVTKASHNSPENLTPFEAFVIIEIIMTALELIMWIFAAIRIPKWKKNYRNQMLLQISVIRFFKRLVFLIVFLKELEVIPRTEALETTLLSLQIYIDFVIVILVFFFIKHMYDSLIVVLVKISELSLYKVLLHAWLLPIPISAVWTAIVANGVLNYWSVYLLICAVFRWPLMLLGTLLYLTILYRVLTDRIRKFARSLAITTFLLCLIINFYLFSKDVIELWCLDNFSTLLVSYISGFLLNLLILYFYIVLIMLNFKSMNTKLSQSIPNFSISVDK
jgi:hypothetical protein